VSFPSVKNRGSLQSVSVVLLIAAGADPISETFPVPPFRIAQCTGERFSFVKLWSCTLLPRVHCTVTPSYLDLSRCPPPVGWFKNSSHVTNEEAGWCTYMYWLVVWNIFCFSIYLEYESQLTNIFQRGWNHQPLIETVFPTGHHLHVFLATTSLVSSSEVSAEKRRHRV